MTIDWVAQIEGDGGLAKLKLASRLLNLRMKRALI